MNTFWLIFHLGLLLVAVILVGRWAWEKIQDKFRPGL